MKRRAAFTLVELIVVMLLTVLLVGSAGAFMHAVAAARDATTNNLHGRQEAVSALRTITTALRNGYRPVTEQDQLFIGTNDATAGSRLRFRTVERKVIRAGQPESDVHEIEFLMRATGEKPVLMRRTDPTKNPPPDGGGVLEPLAQDVTALDLQYFDAGKWNDRWPEDLKRWPTAVNVRLTYRVEASRDRTESVSALVSFPWSAAAEGLSNPRSAEGNTP